MAHMAKKIQAPPTASGRTSDELLDELELEVRAGVVGKSVAADDDVVVMRDSVLEVVRTNELVVLVTTAVLETVMGRVIGLRRLLRISMPAPATELLDISWVRN